MADEASDTLGGGLRNFLGALGFILPLVGIEELVRHFADPKASTLPWWASAILIIVGLPIYQGPAIWRWLTSKNIAQESPQYLSREEVDLGSAVRDMAWLSAWGKWYAAQELANNPKGSPDHREDALMQIAAQHVWRALIDGKLEARGQRPSQINFEAIPSTHWRSSPLHMIRDNTSLWRMILIPTGGAELSPDGSVTGRDPSSVERTNQLAAYEHFIVKARQFESLWPPHNFKTDRARKNLLRKARKAGADLAEIAKLSRDDLRRGPVVGIIVAFILCAAVAALVAYLWPARPLALPPVVPGAPGQRGHSPPAPDAPKARIYTDKTVEQIWDLYCEGRTELQCSMLMTAEKEKWITLGVTVFIIHAGGGAEFGEDEKKRGVICSFGSQWLPALSTLKTGDHLTITGQIVGFNVRFFNLQKCEITKLP